MRVDPLFNTGLARDAVRTRRLAVTALVLGAVAILWAHHPRAAPVAPLALLCTALACAGATIPIAFQAMARIWRTGERGLGRVLFGLLAAVATLSYPADLLSKMVGQPIAAAATTDPSTPPRLSRSTRSLAVRGRVGGDPAHPPAAEKPIVLELDPADAQAAVLKAVAALRWRVVDTVDPGGRLGLGHVDAVAYSPVMHLPQDIAVRVTPEAGQTRVDVLSVARLGIYDFGESAATIRAFSAALEALEED